MNSKYPYALYLDSKILGTARQLCSFFTQGVFSRDNTIVYLKRYKENHRAFSKIFLSHNIPFRFMKPRELDALRNQVVFYAFNAQSNCRLVANRNLKHIFITHGESNKIASVKPIIRIYDHVVMAGKLSLERYYKSGLFDDHDYQIGRLIMMGDTFIGKTGFSSDESKAPVLFYAPTWEGGLESENYSSLQKWRVVRDKILQYTRLKKVETVVIQPHPNLGHRNKIYLRYFMKLLKALIKSKVKVFISNESSFSWRQKIYLKLMKVRFADLNKFYPKHSLVDISAMESMCVNENIDYNLFYSKKMLRDDFAQLHKDIYIKIGICLDNGERSFDFKKLSLDEKMVYKNNLFHWSKENWQVCNKVDRITALLDYIGK